MKLKNILYIILVVFISCKQEVITVVLPDNIPVEMEQYVQNHKYTVMIYVDSTDCTPCSFKYLVPWYPLQTECEKNGIGVLLIIRNSDERAVIHTLESIGTFHFIFDKGGKFKANNKIFKIAKDNIFVMDKNREVIFIDSPIKDKQTWIKFLKRIK
jgi:hypothetical protein